MRPIQKVGSNVRRRLLVPIPVLALLMVAIGAPTASAGVGQRATFTKWVTDWPNMAGVVGGSVGDGAFSGEVIDYAPGPTTLINAIYRFEGPRHAFTARMHVEQTGLHAVVVGVVTDGWGKGKDVSGEYDQVTCEHDGVSTDCFTGYLDVGRKTGD